MTSGVRSFAPRDVPGVVSLMRSSFDQTFWPFMAYAQHGIDAFLSLTLEFPSSFPANESLVFIRDDKAVDGFADFRIQDNSDVYMSYICVRAESKGQGIATRLVNHFVETHPETRELSLGVFRDNVPAKRLYEKLGFETVSRAMWIERALPQPRSEWVQVNSLAAAVAAHRTYGFCELDILFEDQKVRMGWLGDTIIKCATIEDFENDALLAAVRHTFGGVERAFLVATETAEPKWSKDCAIIGTVDQMVLKCM